MKSVMSISLLLLFLVRGFMPNLDVCCELKKIPNLYEHYLEHKDCNGGTSFFQFLADDYFNDNGVAEKHHDDSEHDNLPFHGDDHCCSAPVFYAPDQHFSLVKYGFPMQETFGFYDTFLTSQFPDSPFLPPQG